MPELGATGTTACSSSGAWGTSRTSSPSCATRPSWRRDSPHACSRPFAAGTGACRPTTTRACSMRCAPLTIRIESSPRRHGPGSPWQSCPGPRDSAETQSSIESSLVFSASPAGEASPLCPRRPCRRSPRPAGHRRPWLGVAINASRCLRYQDDGLNQFSISGVRWPLQIQMPPHPHPNGKFIQPVLVLHPLSQNDGCTQSQISYVELRDVARSVTASWSASRTLIVSDWND